jgi:DNA-binding PucR family transcriptional regulator
LIIPDPDGPGRRAAIEAELRDWAAAIGPTVPVTQAARSLRSARRTLELAAHLELDTATPIRSQDHTLTLVLLHGQEMMNDLVDHLLAPLDTFRGHSRRQRLCQTLLMCLQCGFNAAEVAARLHLHPQTIRYRIRQLEEAFGPSIHDPTRNLDYQAALTYWSLTVDPATADDQAGYNGAGSTAGNGSGHATPGSRWPE